MRLYSCFLHWACGCKAYVWNVEPKCPLDILAQDWIRSSILWKRLGSRPDLSTRTLFFRAMASSPRASAAVPPEGEMEVDFGDLEPVEPEDEDSQVVTAEQEAQHLADAQVDFLAGRPSDTLAAPDDLDEKMKTQMEDLQQTIGRLRLGAEANEQAEEWSRSLDSQAQSSEDVAMADGYVEPRPKSKPMAGFVAATCSASLPQPIRFKVDPENHAYSKLVMFPESSRASLTTWWTCWLARTSSSSQSSLLASWTSHWAARRWPASSRPTSRWRACVTRRWCGAWTHQGDLWSGL